MKKRDKQVIGGLALIAGAAFVGGGAWHQLDRPGLLGAMCNIGLPNFSRPPTIDADSLGCKIVGPRRRVSGVLLTAFEASNLIESDLPPAPQGGGPGGSTWWTCNQKKGCDKKLNKQLEQDIAGLCDVRLAKVVAYGWATETPGSYGHMGVYARQFFVDQVVAVGPPPVSVVLRMRTDWAKAGIGDCS